ncbi:hypothetical protein GCM10009850_030760 [Nonomuraea monospora]|uniref:Polyketide cyclase/dehydrase/lipid transport protein n=1 Tax=Nonomuraea monospora TaxID=568818 RepID=A0ABN3CET0_9ACTN
MTVVRFTLLSSLTPAAAMQVLTDFGPDRAQNWPSIDTDHFSVHGLGDTWAEVTEGTAAAWERARYEWDADQGKVVITTLDSKLFGAGGGWDIQLTPEAGGTRVDVRLTRVPRTLKGKILAALLPLAAPSSLRKSFGEPLRAK